MTCEDVAASRMPAGEWPPMPPVFGPAVAVVHLLVVAGRRQRYGRLPVADRQERHLAALQELLDQDPVAARAEDPLLEEEAEGPIRVFPGLDDEDALAAREAVRLEHAGKPELADRRFRLRLASAQTIACAVAIPCRRKNSFAKIFDDSICAASRLGPKIGRPRFENSSAIPSDSGSSGPTTVRSNCSFSARSAISTMSPAETGRQSATSAIPGLPGAQKSSSTNALRRRDQQSACSRPPLPTTRTFMCGAL